MGYPFRKDTPMSDIANASGAPPAFPPLSALLMSYRSARRVSTPLILVQTPDTTATQFQLRKADPFTRDPSADDSGETAIAAAWDCVSGVRGLDAKSNDVLNSLSPDTPLDMLRDPMQLFMLCNSLPKGAVIYAHNLHRFFDAPAVAQAIANLRDAFKQNNRCLVTLCPAAKLPAEIAQDVMVLGEELPGDEILQRITQRMFASAGFDPPTDEQIGAITPALRGLSTYAAEQTLAMSMRSGSKVDMPCLWGRKKQQVEQTDGLTFEYTEDAARSGLDSIGGNAVLKTLVRRLATGPNPFRVLVFLDEIEKSAGTSGESDTSGTSQDALGVMLKGFDLLKAIGILVTSPPGLGKTSIARAIGAEFRVPVLMVDLGAAKGSLVGESEAKIRAVFKVIRALAGTEGGALFFATSNSLKQVPPALIRRLGKFGVHYIDLPTPERRAEIWDIQTRRWNVTDRVADGLPDDTGWTGADIANCCELAYLMGCPLREAALNLSPVSKSNPEAIRAIQDAANGKFLSTETHGFYRKPDSSGSFSNLEKSTGETGRTLDISDH